MLWSESVCLRKGCHFVYGPFSWSREPFPLNKKIDWWIDRSTWEAALPLILEKKTTEGCLFWKGFSDELLMKVGCTEDELANNKKYSKRKDLERWVPVLYNARDKFWQKNMGRCGSKDSSIKPEKMPHCWKNPEGKNKRERGKRQGGWMGEIVRYKNQI
jgi:hypothetical protein